MTNSKISLATARVNAGYTQKKVAERLNIGERTIRRWESGKTAPTPNEILYEMISKFKQLDRVDQGRAVARIDYLLENEKYHIKTVPVKVEGTLIFVGF